MRKLRLNLLLMKLLMKRVHWMMVPMLLLRKFLMMFLLGNLLLMKLLMKRVHWMMVPMLLLRKFLMRVLLGNLLLRKFLRIMKFGNQKKNRLIKMMMLKCGNLMMAWPPKIMLKFGRMTPIMLTLVTSQNQNQLLKKSIKRLNHSLDMMNQMMKAHLKVHFSQHLNLKMVWVKIRT